tara:strand:- start:2249 stop:3664 length:1416 start_codon:yes stop_codon:yes gene_type:complete
LNKNWNYALKRAKKALNIKTDRLLKAEEFSIAFKYAFSNGKPTIDILSDLEKIIPTYAHEEEAFKALKDCPKYRARILEISRESKNSEALAPELLIYPQSVGSQKIKKWTPGKFFHGIICADMHLFTNEFYALVVDAFASDSSAEGHIRFNLLGLKDSWINEKGCVTRAILVDFEHLRLIETDFITPKKLDSVQFISLGRDEIKLHQFLSKRLHCIQVNPFKHSRIADNKMSSYRLWDSGSVPIPETITVIKINELVSNFVEKQRELIFKPNSGTGGQGVVFLRSEIDLHRIWAKIKSNDTEWILQARKDTVLFKRSDNDRPQTLVIRLNVGGRVNSNLKVESGYAQIGRDQWNPASTYHNSRIISKQDLKGKTGYIQGERWQPLELDELFWDQACTIAKQASSIYKNLFLCGIDLIVDVNSSGRPTCLVLEGNARPGGLCRSLCIKNGKPRISSELWNSLYESICLLEKK